jgi:hypothetical protein
MRKVRAVRNLFRQSSIMRVGETLPDIMGRPNPRKDRE